MMKASMVQSDANEKDVVDRSEKNPTWRHALVVGEARVADHLPSLLASHPSETLFLLWQFLTSAHDDVVLSYDIADRLTGESNGHKDLSSAERDI
jgi:hypothetical protein